MLLISWSAARLDGYRLWQLPFGLSLGGLFIGLAGGAVYFLLIVWVSNLRLGHWIPSDLALEIPKGFLAVLLISNCLVPALFEEVSCRGVLWSASIQRAGTGATILLTATFFSLYHVWALPDGHGLPTQFIAGLILGWVRAKTGSITPCILAHFLMNALLYSWVYGT